MSNQRRKKKRWGGRETGGAVPGGPPTQPPPPQQEPSLVLAPQNITGQMYSRRAFLCRTLSEWTWLVVIVCVLCSQCIDKARDLLDAELTAMAGESYSRAYGVSSVHQTPTHQPP